MPSALRPMQKNAQRQLAIGHSNKWNDSITQSLKRAQRYLAFAAVSAHFGALNLMLLA